MQSSPTREGCFRAISCPNSDGTPNMKGTIYTADQIKHELNTAEH